MTDLPATPKGLSASTRRLWRAVTGSYELSAAELEVLRQACVSLDRADEAAGVLASEGLFTSDRYGTRRAHPATDLELRHRTLFARLIAQLGVKIPAVAPVPRRGAQPGRREHLAAVRER